MEGYFAGLVVGTIFCFCLIKGYDTNKPTALDVYRGNTTLEITYKDSVAVDSIVVYKIK